MNRNLIRALPLVLWLAAGTKCFALGQVQYVETVPVKDGFSLVQNKSAASLYVAANDFSGVVIAAKNVQADITRVTGVSPELATNKNDLGANVIIAGTLGRSELIDELIRARKIEVSEIKGRWESFFIQVVPKPFPGVENALVICGSDPRGTIYGLYDLSEEIGVSPWYFWADVPAPHQDSLFVKSGKYIQGPPAVKYRGIFLNDEFPSLGGWAKEKYGGFNHQFYTNVFELLLRLKANYLWPAMWNNAFNEDDPLNPKLADDYGIVMGTSHVEPMMRADKEWSRAGHPASEWNFETHSNELSAFWREGLERNKNYGNFITIAMRGKTDSPMSPTANIALLEKIVAAQRRIIADVYHTNAVSVPQLWALYKEVQEYYERGMRVPDDVTLLWSDDNWGNLRRLPTPDERQRSGGAGVYYHFDYVGEPRNYKWVNTVPIPKIWEQMNLAYQYGADRIWIVNVGSLKLKELPMSFFLNLAWNPSRWPKEKIPEFTRLWVAQQFGPADAPPIAAILDQYTKFNGWRKPELLAPDTFSLVNYQEADRVLAGWKSIAAESEDIYHQLPENERDAFFELVFYPVKACEQVNELYLDVARNRWYSSQGRASANDFAAAARRLFQADADLSADYNRNVAGGKWDHMMDQTHIGYTSWQQPSTNIMPQVTINPVPEKAGMGVALEGSTNAWPDFPGEAILPGFDKFNRPSRYFDIFNRGKTPFGFSARTTVPWIKLSATQGTVENTERIWVTLDWSQVPVGSASGWVKITGAATNGIALRVNSFNPEEPALDSWHGFVEADGYVSMAAEHYTEQVDAGSVRWEKIDGLGETLSAMTIFPVTAGSVLPPQNSPCLEYRMYLFDQGRTEVEAILSPTLNFVPGRGLRFAISFDDQPPQIVDALENDALGRNSSSDWAASVEDGVRKVKVNFDLAKSGEHTLKFWMVDPGVVLQKLIVNKGGVEPAYFGPPESFYHD
jgi:hypothetical protein